MEQKTKIHAEEGKQEILITRTFDLPVELLFKAYIEPGLVEQWMGTKVLKLENHKHGSWQFETTDPKGNKHGFHGTIHELVMNEKITRTFEMDNAPFPAQLEFLEFESTSAETSNLKMHVIYRSVEVRNQILQLPFAQGINMAHNRLEEIITKLK
ncbi:MAG: SRPBCC domain-containing protein [Marinoscillum sp.]